MKSRQYFDKVAPKYRNMTSSGIIGKVREREMKSVMRMLSPKPCESILDAGCGSGFYSLRIKSVGAIVLGVDSSPRMVHEARKIGIHAELCDLESLNLGLKFDKILCAGVLEFCRDPLKVIRRLRAHLREEGIIVFLIPTCSLGGIFYKLYHLSHGLNIILFPLGEIEELLRKADLKIVAVEKTAPFGHLIKTVAIASHPTKLPQESSSHANCSQ